VLPAPPRTLSNLGISRFAPNGPELAASAVGPPVSAETNSRRGGDFGRVVSGLEIPFPGNGDRLRRRHGSNVVATARLSAAQSRSSIELASRPF
jgi:hypothetical protein